MIELQLPWALALLPLPLLAIFLLPRARQEEAALRVPFFATAADYESGGSNGTRRQLLRRILMVLTWLLLVFAASQPRFVGDPIELPVTGRDLMLAVDISGSMGTVDMEMGGQEATRLAVVKQVVGDFVEKRKGDRLGLILFGSQAYLQAPLTFDRFTVQSLLQETPLGIAGGKTAIGDAIGLSVKRLMKRPADSRVLVLLTDGVNNVGEVSPLQAAKLAAQEGITIHSIGFGADELLVQGLLFNRRINPSAELDEKTLTEIAQVTGGIYQRARNLTELASVYEVLDELEPIEQEQETYRPEKSLFHWPLGIAFILSIILGMIHPLVTSGVMAIFWRLREQLNPSSSYAEETS